MKRYILFLLLILSIGIIKVSAASFVEGSYINGEYINKVKDGKTYYMTMKFIKDTDGDIVYCLEPFTKFHEDGTYKEYGGDLAGYKDLIATQKRKISLLVYYGYGYGNRTSNKWYVITQYLIWKVVDSDADIYFTDTLNGNRITKYEEEMEEILNDVNKHDTKPSFAKTYTVNYGDNLTIADLNSDYVITSGNGNYSFNNKLVVNNIKDKVVVKFKKKENYYKNNVVIYDSGDSQDLIRPGNVINKEYTITINVLKGKIELDIKKDDSVYTVEASFKDTCYDIYKNNEIINKVCTNEDELDYLSDDLAYGEYTIKQVSNGIGYREDTKEYKVTVDKNNQRPVVVLENFLIRNTLAIKKYACKNDVCGFEANAKFNIVDKNDNVVTTLTTSDLGYASYELGYGSYTVRQIDGKTDYSLADEYIEKIVDENSLHYKELFNKYMEHEKGEVKKEVVTAPKEEIKEVKQELVKEKVETVEDVPNTKADYNYSILYYLVSLLMFSILLSKSVKED